MDDFCYKFWNKSKGKQKNNLNFFSKDEKKIKEIQEKERKEEEEEGWQQYMTGDVIMTVILFSDCLANLRLLRPLPKHGDW